MSSLGEGQGVPSFCRPLGDGQLLGVEQCCFYGSLTKQLLQHSFLIPRGGHLKTVTEQKERSLSRRPCKGVQDTKTQPSRAWAKREPGWKRELLVAVCEFPSLLKLGKTRRQKEKWGRQAKLRLRGRLRETRHHTGDSTPSSPLPLPSYSP